MDLTVIVISLCGLTLSYVLTKKVKTAKQKSIISSSIYYCVIFYWLVTEYNILFPISLFTIMAVHEIGHFIFIKIYRLNYEPVIEPLFIGFKITEPSSSLKSFITTASGPLSGLLFGLLFVVFKWMSIKHFVLINFAFSIVDCYYVISFILREKRHR